MILQTTLQMQRVGHKNKKLACDPQFLIGLLFQNYNLAHAEVRILGELTMATRRLCGYELSSLGCRTNMTQEQAGSTVLELAKKGYISIQAPARKADQIYTVTIDNDRIFEEAMNAICERSVEESDKFAKLDSQTRKGLLRKKPAERKGRTRNNKA